MRRQAAIFNDKWNLPGTKKERAFGMRFLLLMETAEGGQSGEPQKNPPDRSLEFGSPDRGASNRVKFLQR